MWKERLFAAVKVIGKYFLGLIVLAGAYFLVEVFSVIFLAPDELSGLAFGAAWAVILSAFALLLPRLGARIFFGITYYVSVLWVLIQTGYYKIFGRMLWIGDIFYAGEGAEFLGDILDTFSAWWWLGGIVLVALGVLLVWKFPRGQEKFILRAPYAIAASACFVYLSLLPEMVFVKDLDIWGTRSEYAQSSSYRATYNTMYDAKNTYDICGFYQLTFRDVWKHELYPLTPAYRKEISRYTQEIDNYFAERAAHEDNEMTGIFEGKNVIMVLMESMDDWMITPEDTPTLMRLMGEGITFSEFYTPGYGTARTINSEFCMNTGIYLPTNGQYVFNYVTNDFDQSIASQLTNNGYTAEVFHYNTPAFYSRGVFEPAMGYRSYVGYGAYTDDKNMLYNDSALFQIPEVNELFFREGKTFNMIITRSAHLSYKYNEVLSHYALKQYPGYRGRYGSEEEDCARVKARLVDDMFAELLNQLTLHGQLENTVIVAMTDHYTYGYKNTDELLAHSNVSDPLLLERTPCFIWSADAPAQRVEKTLNTADLLPTVLNLLGIDSPHRYLGQDAFDPNYEGYALFPNGSWISDGVACKVSTSGDSQILRNTKNKQLSQQYLEQMSQQVNKFINISNLLLISDYYKTNS